MGKGSQTTTSTTAPNPQAMAAYQDILARAQTAASAGYAPYSGELVAPFNAQQNTGVAGINDYANFAQPYIQTAGQMATSAAQPITAAQIAQYQSPYTQSVIDATQAQFDSQNAQQLSAIKGNAIAQGALGGNREAIAQAEAANQQQLAQAPVIAGLRNQGYTTGLNTALTEQQALASGAYSLGNLGVAGQSAGLTGAAAQFGAGSSQQQTQQAQDAAAYQQYLNQLAFPYQQTQWLAGIGTGVGSQMGGTGTQTAPEPSMLGQVMGGLTSGVGALGGTGAFGAAGWLTALMSSGGAVGRASGGVAPDPEQQTIPEGHDTLRAQQQQLVDGHRRVHMFPHGTPELHIPPGMHRVAAHSGVFHYDPKKIHPDEIRHLAARGRENELLDLGPIAKDEVIARIRRGELPLAIVERQPDGTEVRAAAGTHLTARHQVAAMQKTKSPGNRIGIEDVRNTLAHRVHRAWGGRVPPHFDTGGGVANPAFEGPGAGMPYGGGKSWIPTNAITRGAGAPKPPSSAAPNQSVAKMGEQIGSMAKAITGGNTDKAASTGPFAVAGPSAYGLSPGDISATPSNWGIGGNGANGIVGGAGDMMVPTFAKDGGSIGRFSSGGIANLPVDNRIMMPPGYAEGGAPYEPPFDPMLGGIAPGPELFNIDPGVSDVAKSILSGGVPMRQSAGFDDGPSPLDTANWPHGPVHAPGPIVRGDQPSPLDSAEWPQGPVNAPGPISDGAGPSPLDSAAWPSGPVGAPEGIAPGPSFGDRFAGDPAAARDSGIAALSPAPLDLPNAGGFRGPAPAVTGREAIPPAAAVNYETPTAGYADNMDRIAAAHRKIESEGRGGYHALGPVHPKTGDRAYGAYQVMGANVPVWTKEILGVAMTPDQFLNSKDAQDTVYKAKMGSYINQLGLPGAVHAWLGPGKKDFTGTTQEKYLKNFETALNGAPSDGGVSDRGDDRGDDRRMAFAGSDRDRDGDLLPPKETPAQAKGVAPAAEQTGIDWSEKGKLWPTLMAAGFGMMASRSPFPGVAIGEGGQQGLATYSALKDQENKQKMSQAHLDLEAKKLTQAGDIAHQKLQLATKPYSEMTQYQRASVEATRSYRQGLLDRENAKYLGPTADGKGSVIMDTRSGIIKEVPIQVAPRPVAGAVATLARTLMDEREKQRQTDPNLPPLSFEDATALAHRAPNADQDTIRRLNLASGAWKSWQNNPVNMGKKDAPENNLEFWEKRYGVSALTPPSGTAKAQPAAAVPAPAPAAAKPAAAPAAAPMPPRPATVPADAKPQRSKSTGAVRWVAADGSVYSADGTRQP